MFPTSIPINADEFWCYNMEVNLQYECVQNERLRHELETEDTRDIMTIFIDEQCFLHSLKKFRTKHHLCFFWIRSLRFLKVSMNL